MCEVVVDKLTPLHHHEGVSDVGRAHVVVDVDGDEPGAGEGLPRGDGPGARAHQTVVVRGGKESEIGVVGYGAFCFCKEDKYRL